MSDVTVSYPKARSKMPALRAWLLVIGGGVTVWGAAWMVHHGPREDPSQTHCSGIAFRIQTLRGQIELYKIQHGDMPPAESALAAVMLGKTRAEDTSVCGA